MLLIGQDVSPLKPKRASRSISIWLMRNEVRLRQGCCQAFVVAWREVARPPGGAEKGAESRRAERVRTSDLALVPACEAPAARTRSRRCGASGKGRSTWELGGRFTSLPAPAGESTS